MAITFNKKSWKSRISEHPTRRRLTIVDASLGYSLVDVARDEGTVEQVGDTFDKSTMDDLENRIENIAITAQAECDGLQEQIDALPSLDDTKAIDIGWKESGTRNVAGDTIKVNNYDLYMGEIGKQVVQFGRVYGSTSQRTSPAPSPSEPAPINGVGIQGANNTWTVSKTVNGCTATVTGLPYPLYEGDYIDFDAGILHRETAYKVLNGSEDWSSYSTQGQYGVTLTDMLSGTYNLGYSDKFIVITSGLFVANSIRLGNNNQRLFVLTSISGVTDIASWKTWLSNNNTIITYPLATATDTQVTVEKTGKNLLVLIEDGKVPSVSDGQLVNSSGCRSDYILVEPNTDYTFSCGALNTGYFFFYDENLNYISYMDWSTPTYSKTKTSPNNARYIMMRINGTLSSNPDSMLEKGSTATSYEPYGLPTVIRGFIPSAKFFQMGRRYWQEEPVKTYLEDLNDIYKGMRLNVDNNAFVTQEQVDKDRVNEILTMYGYDYDHDEFLTSVSGEILTASGKITCDLVVTDIWGCGANNATEVVLTTANPIQIDDRTASNSNGFPIELKIANQSQATSFVVGSPVFFRITGELYILLHMGFDLREYTDGSDMSQFYKLKRWIDTRDGMHYSTHYIEIEKGATFNLSSITTARGYNFLQCSVRTGQSIDPRDYLEWTVTDSEVAITATASATGYAEGLILEIDHRMINDTQGQYDTHESIIVKTIPAST